MKALLLIPVATLAVFAVPLSRRTTAPETGHRAADSVPARFEIGRAATSAEIEQLDIDARPDGHGLPAGQGTFAEGKRVFTTRCMMCHGRNGEGVRQGTVQLGPALIGRKPGDAFDFNASVKNEGTKTIGNYWPYATTVFDYVRRAMPFDRPGSLSNADVYAVTAYLLARNQIIDSTTVIDAKTLVKVKMPSAGKFVRDDREAFRVVR
jgi:mono/diheme cytochrome c family protein